MCEKLGKAADGEILDILKIFLKKTSDTNSFLSETASEGLDSLCNNCSEARILINIVSIAENARNPAIKAKLMYCITKIILKSRSGILKMRDINKALQHIYEYLSDANPEVRNEAKHAYDTLIENIPDESHLEMVVNQGINGSAFRKIKDAVKRKSRVYSESMISLSKKNMTVTLPSLVKTVTKKLVSSSAREIIQPLIISDPEEFKKIQQIESGILDVEWKIRYEAITNASDLVKACLSLLVSSNKLLNIMEVIQKGLIDSNLKVLIHTLTLFVKMIPLINKKLENYLNLLIEPLLSCLGSSNTSIRDVA